MTEKEIKQIKLPDLSWLKSIGESFKKMNVGAFAAPKIENFVDPKTEMMAHIEHNTDEMRENSKNPFWKSLLIAVIGGAIGGAAPYLLALIFG